VARALVSRLHREVLLHPTNGELSALLRSLFEFPDVPQAWRQPDFSQPNEPALVIRLQRNDLRLSFLTTLTSFNAPGNVTLEEVSIESYFPMDDETRDACTRLGSS
jgi:hypothetical protein